MSEKHLLGEFDGACALCPRTNSLSFYCLECGYWHLLCPKCLSEFKKLEFVRKKNSLVALKLEQCPTPELVAAGRLMS